jgi:hypothetical protein
VGIRRWVAEVAVGSDDAKVEVVAQRRHQVGHGADRAAALVARQVVARRDQDT